MMRFKVSALIRAEVGAQLTHRIDEPERRLGHDLTVDYLRGNLLLTRTDQHILVAGDVNTALSTECVRCLDTFRLPLRIRLEELFSLTFGPHTSDAVYVVAPDGTVDLTLPLREQILLVQPIQPICQPNCKGLCSTCGKNLNEGPCNCEDESIDPRLATLKALL